MSYSEVVLDHFRNPRHAGDLPNPDGRHRGENPVCGDTAEFALQPAEGRIVAVRFRALGCVAAIAASSCLSELVEGLPVEEARTVDVERLLSVLGGLPASKKHGASLAVEVFRRALQNALNSSDGAS